MMTTSIRQAIKASGWYDTVAEETDCGDCWSYRWSGVGDDTPERTPCPNCEAIRHADDCHRRDVQNLKGA